jgi:hypothetical protein
MLLELELARMISGCVDEDEESTMLGMANEPDADVCADEGVLLPLPLPPSPPPLLLLLLLLLMLLLLLLLLFALVSLLLRLFSPEGDSCFVLLLLLLLLLLFSAEGDSLLALREAEVEVDLEEEFAWSAADSTLVAWLPLLILSSCEVLSLREEVGGFFALSPVDIA